MAEYIEREAAKIILERVRDKCGNDEMAFALNWASRLIRDIPAADVVARDCFDRLLAENDRLRQERPVVRCRDCKHYDCEDGDQKCVKDAEWDEEEACYFGFISYHGPEFYCADGERR